nr:MAG TPA: hypothetical protein [Caudoviricetes sp.]
MMMGMVAIQTQLLSTTKIGGAAPNYIYRD